MAEEIGAAPSEAARRLHVLIYSVVYPAFLGSFIFALLQAAGTPVGRLGWGLLLATHFTLQQIEARSLEIKYADPNARYSTR